MTHHPRQGPDSSDTSSQVRTMFPHTSQDRGKFKMKTVKFIPHLRLSIFFPQPCTCSLFQLLAHSGGRRRPGQLLPRG